MTGRKAKKAKDSTKRGKKSSAKVEILPDGDLKIALSNTASMLWIIQKMTEEEKIDQGGEKSGDK